MTEENYSSDDSSLLCVPLHYSALTTIVLLLNHSFGHAIQSWVIWWHSFVPNSVSIMNCENYVLTNCRALSLTNSRGKARTQKNSAA